MMNRLQDRRTAAFTLVEIVIVVAIGGMLAAAAVPAFRSIGSRSSSTVEGAARTLRQYLRSARTYAVENRVKTALCYVQRPRWVGELEEFELPEKQDWWTGYVLVYEDSLENWHRFRGGQYSQRIPLPNQVHIEPGRFVDITADEAYQPEAMLEAFRGDPDRPYVRGYNAFKPSGSGTLYNGDSGWIPLAGQSKVYLYDERTTGRLAVNVVNTTGAVKITVEGTS